MGACRSANMKLDTVTLPDGVITTYAYDPLDRVDVETQYAPDETPTDLTDNLVLARYDYTVDFAGKRTAVTENRREADGSLSTDSFAWTYDALGRLKREVYNAPGTVGDYTADYVMDLVGNRVT